MSEIDITFGKKKIQSIKMNRFSSRLNGNLKRGLQLAGFFAEGELKKSLKGSNPTTFFYKSTDSNLRSRTSALRDSITTRQVAGGKGVQVGPHQPYAMIHEFGGRIFVTEKMRAFLHHKGVHLRRSTTHIIIPKRTWFAPVVGESRPGIARIIQKEINKPLKGR